MHVLHLEKQFVVVAKPPGVSVHRQSRFPNERPMLQQVRDYFGKKVWPVHRLDRQASGCLIFAFSNSDVAHLANALALGKKYYIALVRGYFHELKPIVISTPIKTPTGYKDAKSSVVCLGRSTNPRCSVLRVQPHTGRHHQVRRHVRDLNHPIIHDGDHGDSRVNRWWREKMNVSRLGLHACELDLPTINLKIVCPLFVDHYQVFKNLPFWDDLLKQEKALSFQPISFNE